MVDAGRLAALLERLSVELTHLRRLAAWEAEELINDELALPAAKYRLAIAIEIAVDAGEHIIASEGLRSSLNYADTFAVLGESDWLEQDLSASLQDAARFRNLLIHGYATVNDSRVAEILKTRLNDLDAFRTAVAGTALAHENGPKHP